MNNVLLVSADGHGGAPPEYYRDYMDPEYLDDLDALIEVDRVWRSGTPTQSRYSAETLAIVDRDDAIRNMGELGAYELDRRLAFLDHEGIAAELIIYSGHQVAIPVFYSIVNTKYSAGHRAAGVRAYHRQLADMMAGSRGRLFGIADPGTCLHMEASIAELQWVAKHGFVGVGLPGFVADDALPPLGDPYFDRWWAACIELGLAATAHGGHGVAQRGEPGGLPALPRDIAPEEMLKASHASDVSLDQLPAVLGAFFTGTRRVFWQMMIGGVFDRFPDLKLVLTEVRSDWVPAVLDILDEYFAKPGHRALKGTPRDYWHRHVYITPSSPRPYELAMRHEVGLRHLMFGADFPHPEGTWPNTREWIQDAFRGIPEDEARLILGLNAVECYGLDSGKLTEIAEQIGPEPEEIFGDHAVNPQLVETFDWRSGYRRRPEQPDASMYNDLIHDDEAIARSA